MLALEIRSTGATTPAALPSTPGTEFTSDSLGLTFRLPGSFTPSDDANAPMLDR